MALQVTYCRNFTDIDDKIIAKAEKEYGNKLDFEKIAALYISHYHEDMRKLNCLAPTYEPKVTENIPEIIAFIEELIKKNVAYAIDGDVYFSIDNFPSYGSLSKHKLEDLAAGERIEINEKKRNPLDFALWKHDPDAIFWKSPWGYGRPGWHIECSALALKYLGKEIDIHAGGLDLVFPHHENEKAQTEALTGLPFAHYWIHNGFVQINKEKMSKSLGNFFTLRDVFHHVDPMVVRYYILTHHYRAPLEFSLDALHVAEKSYRKLCKSFAHIQPEKAITQESQSSCEIIQEMLAFLTDDLNTPGMFGVLYSSLSHVLTRDHDAAAVKGFLQEILGLTLDPLLEKEEPCDARN